jgi:DNA polymerase/3'-5' exonuclease PolX
VELAGSLRRYENAIERGNLTREAAGDVGDIELVLVPKWGERPVMGSLLDDITEPFNLAHDWLTTQTRIEWKHCAAKGKNWRGVHTMPRIPIDIWVCDLKNWGYIHMLRTGDAEFMRGLVTWANRRHMPFREGHLHISGVPVETPDEKDVFDRLGLRWVDPAERTSMYAVRKKVGR